MYKSICLSGLDVLYLLNLFLLSTVSLAIVCFNSTNYQITTIVSISLSLAVCLVTMAMHFKQSFDLKRIKRKLGFKDRPEYIALAQVASDEDCEIEKPPRSASPPSMVYGSSRGEHQFVLQFSLDGEEEDSPSPVLLKREPLLFT